MNRDKAAAALLDVLDIRERDKGNVPPNVARQNQVEAAGKFVDALSLIGGVELKQPTPVAIITAHSEDSPLPVRDVTEPNAQPAPGAVRATPAQSKKATKKATKKKSGKKGKRGR